MINREKYNLLYIIYLMDLRHGDCLEVMKELEKDSVDLLFADLPYSQTSCKWDYN